jgi:RNA polymerase sigma factor (sigma-70 family)
MADANDNLLIQEYADRNSESAFAALVPRHINLVYSVAFRYVGNSQDAQDVTQAVFVVLARKAGSLRGRNILTGWLYETARLTASQLLRTNARQKARDREAYMQSILDQSGNDTIWRQLAPHLEAAMSRLRAADRELLALRFYENKTGAEAAALLGIGAEAAHKRTNRALDKLRKFFLKRGIDSTAATIAEQISAHSVQAVPVALAKAVTAVALAKGATASLSTLTLIKGALKIMAWTKAKTAIVAGVAVILATSSTIIALKEIKPPSGSSKVAVSFLNITNIDGHLFGQFSFVNRDRRPIRLRGFLSEVEGDGNELAPIVNIHHPWPSTQVLKPGESEILLVGAPTEPGKWRFCVQFSPNATMNVWDGLTNVFVAKSRWLSGNR